MTDGPDKEQASPKQPRVAAASLSEEDKAKLMRHLNAKWKSKTCPFCHANHWEIGGWTPVMVGRGPGAVVIGGGVLPSVSIVCGECGFTAFVNAVVAGLDRHVG